MAIDRSPEQGDEDISSQLHETLHQSIASTLSTRRPLLTHLNADTTWLLSLPYPTSSPSLRDRSYYHVLIDPWLQGPQSDVAAFFSQQWHAEPSAVQTIAEVEEVIKGIEGAATGRQRSRRSHVERENTIVVDHDTEDRVNGTGIVGASTDLDEENISQIDAVVISHEFTDHMHQDTLLEISRTVPVFATTKAASIIKSWKHFGTVLEVPRFTGDWRKSSLDPLPRWISISRVAYAGQDLLYYHSAIMICFTDEEDGLQAKAIIYTPHGISPNDLAPISTAFPKINTLALLHGLQDITLTRAQLNMGAHNGLKVQRLLHAKYWIGTHDEVKRGGGIVSWFLRRKIITLRDAIEQEKQEHGGNLEGNKLEDLSEVRFKAPGNGESLILE